jgi:tryptophan 2,3-dioxygenase
LSAIINLGTVNPFRGIRENINSLNQEIEQFQRSQARALEQGREGAAAGFQAAIDNAKRRIEFLKFQELQQARRLVNDQSTFDARDLARLQREGDKPQAPALPDTAKLEAEAKRAAAERERLRKEAEAERDRIAKDVSASLQAQQEIEDEANRLGVEFLQRQAKKTEDESKKLKELADSYVDLIDPVEKYRKQLIEIDKLVEKGFLTQAQATEAIFQIQLNIDKVTELGDEVKKTDSIAQELGLTFSSAFEDAAISGKKFSEVLRGLAQDIGRIILRNAVTEPLAQAGKNLFGKIDFSNIFAFAGGGSFQVGGSGGTDSQLVAFRATPNERVTIETPEQQRSGSGGNFHFNIDARGAQPGVEDRIRRAVSEAVTLAVQAVEASSNRGGSFARAVGRR